MCVAAGRSHEFETFLLREPRSARCLTTKGLVFGGSTTDGVMIHHTPKRRSEDDICCNLTVRTSWRGGVLDGRDWTPREVKGMEAWNIADGG